MNNVNNVGAKIEKIIELTMDISSQIAVFQARIKELEDKLSILNTFKEVNYYIGVEKEIKNVIRIIIDVVMGVLGVNSCSINLLRNDTWEINESTTLSNNRRIITEKNILELNDEMEKRNGEIVIRDLSTFQFVDLKEGALLALTLSRGPHKFGFINVYYSDSDVLTEGKLELFKLLSKQLEIHLENAFLFEKLQMVSISDEQTGLYNRMHLNEILFKKSTVAADNISIIMIDIDNFKKINDSYGHLFGDLVIQELSEIIKRIQKKYNVTGFRYGGEEFLILCDSMSLKDVKNVAEEVRSTFNNISHNMENNSTTFSISLGISQFGLSSCVLDVNYLIDSADIALYYSKHNGKNRYTVSTGNIQLFMKSNLELNKVKEKIKRYNQPYSLLKLSIGLTKVISKNDHLSMVSSINKIFRMYDSVYYNNLGDFLIVLEKSENAEALENRVRETLISLSYDIKRLETIILTDVEFDMNKILDIEAPEANS